MRPFQSPGSKQKDAKTSNKQIRYAEVRNPAGKRPHKDFGINYIGNYRKKSVNIAFCAFENAGYNENDVTDSYNGNWNKLITHKRSYKESQDIPCVQLLNIKKNGSTSQNNSLRFDNNPVPTLPVFAFWQTVYR
ncbi:MAG: hypothetical protein JWQ40_3072 [Segetibacter sp.]|nr:hypothetical protein [Segetibacter sp.]